MSDTELKSKVGDYFGTKTASKSQTAKETSDYNVDNSNVNHLLTDNEREDILRAIKTINEAKRSLIDTGGDFLYIVDHTDKDGLNHLKENQEGYLVKEIIDIKGRSKEEINNIKLLCNEEGAIRTLQDFNRRLEGIGYKGSIYNSDSIDAKDKASNYDNAGLDKQALGRETFRGQGAKDSQDDFSGGQIKTGYDGTKHSRYMDAEAAKELIDNMSGQQLRDELSIIKQESADYDLINGIEEEHKHSGKAVPQDFTFADGTKIEAPFRPNEQQIVALNEMDRFLKSDETSMTLSGYAGTGKTSLMEMIAKKAVKDGKDIQFCASTNKAAKVLKDKVSKAGFDAKTLHKVFGIRVEGNPESKQYDAKNVINIQTRPKVDPGTTVIIDEASMINKRNYDTLNKIAKDFSLKLIYVGDEAQLAPVGETEVSKVFSNGDGKVIHLTQVERTDDNAILKEATDIRNGKPLSGVTSFNSKGEGVAYILPKHQDAINEVLDHYVKGLKKNPDYFRVLAYYNDTVSRYNNKIRSLLGFDSPTPRVGEPMTGYTNWGYIWQNQSYRLVNSEAYKVVKVEKPMTTTFVVDDGTQNGALVSLEYIPITLRDSMGETDTFNYIDVKNNEQNRKAAVILANKKQELWDKAMRMSKKAAKPLHQEISRIDQFLFVNDDIKSSDGERTLQSKVIDFGYAMTVHKSQGSTFTHVLVDDIDIALGARDETKGKTTFTDLDIDDTPQEASDENVVSIGEEIDLDDDTSTPTPQATESTATDPNHVDKRQQLEYVAVSRATDTVTIISDNVKKEGSPLHPEEAIKEDSANKNTQPSQDTDSAKSIVNQLVEHLKSITKVFGREDMAEFLKTHNLKSLQQFINKHTLPKGELSTLSSALMTKYGNNNAFGDVIQTANYEYTVNYKGAGEFDIIEYHQIDNNLSKEIDDTEREGISEAYDSLSTKDEVTKGQYPSDSHNVEDREANGDNAGLDKQTSQGESKQAKSDASSNQHQEWRAIKRDSATGRITFVDGDGRTISSPEDLKDAQLFTTPQGEVYGFVDKEGNIYLDETKISPEHPIHEYTHLWDRMVQQKNPKLWQRGVELMKQTSLWNEILNDENYGKVWQSMNLPQERLDNLIASEVHARFTGKGGEQLLEKLAKEKGQSGIIDKLKQWILDVWKDLKATFSNWSQEDLDRLTLKDFNHMTVRDFAEGVNLKEAKVPTPSDNIEVSLPNYEKEVGTLESLSVPKWKVSFLKELDVQIAP